MRTSDPAPGWFRQHFNEDYKTIYCGRDQAQAEKEVARLERELSIVKSDSVLDLCCGYGRHLCAFARRGIPAVGVDLSLALLKTVEPRSSRRLICADMRALPFAGGERGFSVVVNFFTSFGYFLEDTDNLLAAREMARVLRPGGRFSIDLMNAAPAIRTLESRSEREAGAHRLIEERSYDAARRRIEKRITLVEKASGATKRYFESVRIFTPAEIADLLCAAGLEVRRMLGDFDGNPYGADSPRMIALGRVARAACH